MNKTLKFNNREFCTEDLFRYEEIEKNPESANEKFLCEMVEKFFFRLAQLQEEIKDLNYQLECADLGEKI